MIWAYIKIFEKNNTFKFSDVNNLFHEAVVSVSPEKWKNYVENVQNKIETKMWEFDIIEINLEPININLQEVDESSTSDFSQVLFYECYVYQ